MSGIEAAPAPRMQRPSADGPSEGRCRCRARARPMCGCRQPPLPSSPAGGGGGLVASPCLPAFCEDSLESTGGGMLAGVSLLVPWASSYELLVIVEGGAGIVEGAAGIVAGSSAGAVASGAVASAAGGGDSVSLAGLLQPDSKARETANASIGGRCLYQETFIGNLQRG